jgi:hypothetical protein
MSDKKSISHGHQDIAQHRQGFHRNGHIRHFHSRPIRIVPFSEMEDSMPGEAIDIAPKEPTHRTLEEKEKLIHFAVLRNELWSPICEGTLHWSVPLCSNLEQITCPECKSEVEASPYNRS